MGAAPGDGMSILAIDPGNAESAWVLIDPDTLKPIAFGKEANGFLRTKLWCEELTIPYTHVEHAAIEMVASYGMAVGAEVFDTVLWSGRFAEVAHRVPVVMLPRRAVKLALCGDSRAKDANIRQALIDRFGGPAAVGRKASPGPLYGISRDVWSALAIAVTYTVQGGSLERA